MEKRFSLSRGYTISRVINGCWQLSQGHTIRGELDFADVKKAFYDLFDAGFTTFDCADIYTGAEEFIGGFIREMKSCGHPDDEIQVHTKYVPDLSMLSEVNFDFTEKIIDRSLKRLGKDILDAVQFHWWDYDTPGMTETAGHLMRLKEKGKIRNVSVTNFDTPHLKELVDAGIEVASIQTQYSVLDTRPEKSLADYCRKQGIQLICYGTLAGGFLSERWLGADGFEPETRSQVKYLQVIEDTVGWDGFQKLLALLSDIAGAHGVGISQVATGYILKQSGVAAAIIGVRNSRHVADNSKIFGFDLSDAELERIRSFIKNYPALCGEPFELERTVGSKYRNIMHMNINGEEQNNAP